MKKSIVLGGVTAALVLIVGCKINNPQPRRLDQPVSTGAEVGVATAPPKTWPTSAGRPPRIIVLLFPLAQDYQSPQVEAALEEAFRQAKFEIFDANQIADIKKLQADVLAEDFSTAKGIAAQYKCEFIIVGRYRRDPFMASDSQPGLQYYQWSTIVKAISASDGRVIDSDDAEVKRVTDAQAIRARVLEGGVKLATSVIDAAKNRKNSVMLNISGVDNDLYVKVLQQIKGLAQNVTERSYNLGVLELEVDISGAASDFKIALLTATTPKFKLVTSTDVSMTLEIDKDYVPNE